MLVKVSVENFKSFDKAAELTMISSNKIRTNANHRLKIKSTQLLKYAVVYGANASGKTNLALFFKFFKDSVCNGIPIEATQMFCKNRKENKERESSFEIQITVGDKFYAYGFSAVLSRRKVTGEWLYELYQNGSAKCLFEREGSKRPVLNDGITLINKIFYDNDRRKTGMKSAFRLCFIYNSYKIACQERAGNPPVFLTFFIIPVSVPHT